MNIISFIFLIVAMLWTIYLGFPQFKVFKKLKAYQKNNSNPKNKEAFLVSLATNLGAGNLVGVTAGIIIGGPGVIVWMWIFAFFASALSLVENTYAVKYQEVINGEKRGGACFYILKGLKSKTLSFVFAIFLLLTNTIFFPPIQVNTIVTAVKKVTPLPSLAIGIIVFAVLSLLVFKGTKKIIKASERIVPFMSYSFVGVIIFLMIIHYRNFPNTIITILEGAFDFKSVGTAYIITAVSVGIRRSLFSHEAGLGTVPSIAGMGSNENVLEQGFFQMLGVYVDTLLLCTMTGICIIQVSPDFANYSGSDLLISVFTSTLGQFGLYLGAFFLFIFSFASILGQYYLGESNALFLSKMMKVKPKKMIKYYRLIYSIGIVMGIILTTSSVLTILDYGMLSIGMVNIIVLFLLEKREKLLQKELKNGIIY